MIFYRQLQIRILIVTGPESAVILLIENGADINAVNNNKNSVLIEVIISGNHSNALKSVVTMKQMKIVILFQIRIRKCCRFTYPKWSRCQCSWGRFQNCINVVCVQWYKDMFIMLDIILIKIIRRSMNQKNLFHRF